LKKMQRFAVVAAGIGMLTATATAAPAMAGTDPKPSAVTKLTNQLKAAQAKASASKKSLAAEPCEQSLGWVTADGMVDQADVTPAKPPMAKGYAGYKFVTARASATWYLAYNAAGTKLTMSGLFLQGGNLYRHVTGVSADTGFTTTVAKVGSGWTSFKAIATSNYSAAKPRHAYLYGLNADGNVYRYAQNGNAISALGKFAGFKSFKTVTVIAETATYDTLLMTTNAGALYTIHIPITATAKPVVKLIRSGGWQSFEQLVVDGCGTKGGLLITAIDRDTKTAQMYAMSKATGTTTQLTGYGRIPASAGEYPFDGVFDGTADATVTTYYDQLVSE
jgi:hypothetical protein